MKNQLFIFILCSMLANSLYTQDHMTGKTDWTELDKVFGKKGNLNGDIYKITFPRNDLNVVYDNKKIEPALAFTSWIAFMDMSSMTMMMGDLVLQDNEVPSVEKKLASDGILITAIHNHLSGESPDIKYIHYSAMGDAVTLAKEIKEVLSLTSTPMEAQKTATEPSDIDWSKVENILGFKGNKNGKIIQFGIPRNDKIREMGIEIPPYMGMATTINMQMSDANNAFATGDFVLIDAEVNPVIKELTDNGITVTALHNHMLDENPRIFFMHYWGYDTPEKIASGLKKALEKTNSAVGKN